MSTTRGAGGQVPSARAGHLTSKTQTQFQLRGRDRELELIEQRLGEVRAGVGAVMILEGRAGVGKTSLLDACSEKAKAKSIRVRRGVAEASRQVVELQALLEALFER